MSLGLFEAAVASTTTPFLLASLDTEKPDILRHFPHTKFSARELFSGIPSIDKNQCRYCGWCVQFCQHNAIRFDRYVPSISVDAYYCEACGNCLPSCHRNVLSAREERLGFLLHGRINGSAILVGKADEQQDFLLPLACHINEYLKPETDSVLDMPPGVSPLVRVSLRKATHMVVVVKPSLGWKRNVKPLIEMAREMNLPLLMVVNKYRNEESFLEEVTGYCSENRLPVPFVIPYSEGMDSAFWKKRIIFDGNVYENFRVLWNILFLPGEIST